MSGRTWEHDPARGRGPLYRDPENGWVMGVCAGIAQRFDLNVFGVRLIAFISLLILTLPTLLVYFLLGLILRERPLCYCGGRDERRFWRENARRSDAWEREYE